MSVLELSLCLLLFIAVGFIARKTKVMPDGFDKMLSRFVLAVPLPCMIVNSFNIEYSPGLLLSAPLIAGLCVGSMALMFLLVFLATRWIRDGAMRKTVRFCLLFTNYTFVGFPVVRQLYGAEGFFTYVIFTLPIRLFFYGGGSVMLGKRGEKIDVKETIKRFLCPPVIAVFIGFALYALQLDLPPVLDSTIESIGNMASPLGLMLCGAIIADADLKSALRHPSVLAVTVCRLLVVPAAALGLFWLLRVDTGIVQTSLYFFAMPVASLTPTFLLRYDPEAIEARTAAGYMVVVSTLFCVLTIPLWTMILNRLIP